MHSDPVADLLTRVRNGYRARLPFVDNPHSKLKEHIAQILLREGYVGGFTVRSVEGRPQDVLRVELKYDAEGIALISGIKRESKPGGRVYSRFAKLKKIRNGLGIYILTTSRGLMTDAEAQRAKVGGEILCSVW